MAAFIGGGCKAVRVVALDDVSVTEWRLDRVAYNDAKVLLHSMTSVLLNGGAASKKTPQRSCSLHSMTSVLLNGGLPPLLRIRQRLAVALDDVSVTEWRLNFRVLPSLSVIVALDDVSVTEWRCAPASTSVFVPLVALDDVSVTEWRPAHQPADRILRLAVALDDVSVTEWRHSRVSLPSASLVALDDVSVTEWRQQECKVLCGLNTSCTR